MPKSRISKKVKQVAARARTKNPRPTSPPRQELYTGSQGIEQVVSAVERSIKSFENEVGDELGDVFPVESKTGLDPYFGPEQAPGEARREALDRAKKVDVKVVIKDMIQGFLNGIDLRLNQLSERVESQLQPLVRAVAEVAVTKKELSRELTNFGDELSVLLNLNEELDPIDIEDMFSFAGEQLDRHVGASEPFDGVLDEAIKDASATGAVAAVEEADDYQVN